MLATRHVFRITALALTAACLVVAPSVAAAPLLEPSTQLLTYQPARVGTTQIRWISFTNRTGGPIDFGPVGVFAIGDTAFALDRDTCGSEVVELAAGKSCRYAIAFRPKATGRFRARLVYAVAGVQAAAVELRGKAG